MSEPEPPFVLTPAEKATPLWMRLQEYYGNRLTETRKKNDQPWDATETARLRGRLSEIKHLLGLTESPGDTSG